jgi:hypothetical protein
MEVWSTFAAQILGVIENGAVRYPGIAADGVMCRYVDAVLQHFFSPLHTPGLTTIGSDAALALLCLDMTNEVFIWFQLDAELLQYRGPGAKRVIPEEIGARGSNWDPPLTEADTGEEKEGWFLLLRILRGEWLYPRAVLPFLAQET